MCRMLIAAGDFDMPALLDSFMKMATGTNERHERNADRIYDHPDGWGIAYLEDGRFRKYKKEVPVWEDDAFGTYRAVKSPAVLLHARRSSATKA